MDGNIKLKKDTIKEIEKLKKDFDLKDIWRIRNPSFRKFSWRRTKVTLRRLDYFLISSQLEQNILVRSTQRAVLQKSFSAMGILLGKLIQFHVLLAK